MIQIHYSFFFLAALLILILPLDWLLAVVSAALVHELCHILALCLLGGKIRSIHIQPSGCIIESSRIGEGAQFFSILAGPLGSFVLLFLCRTAPRMAICGFFQGMYNLLPVLPLDGGRMLRLVLYAVCPEHAEKAMAVVAFGACVVITFGSAWLTAADSAGLFPLIFSMIWNIKYLPRKIPCKPWGIGVQ